MENKVIENRVPIWGLATLVAATSCATFSGRDYTPTDQVSLGAAVAFQAADVGTTIYGLEQGLKEANPLLGEHPSTAVLIAVKIVGVALIYSLGELDPEHRAIIFSLSGAIGGLAAGWNWYQIDKLK